MRSAACWCWVGMAPSRSRPREQKVFKMSAIGEFRVYETHEVEERRLRHVRLRRERYQLYHTTGKAVQLYATILQYAKRNPIKATPCACP